MKNIYVGNLDFNVTEDELRKAFGAYGQVDNVTILKDRDTGQSKGFAFVTMASQADAQKAIGMFNAFTMQERELKVNTAKAREDRNGGAGGYQSKLGAFGPRGNPHKHRPRGGNRRY